MNDTHTVELNIVGSAAAVEDLDADLALSQARSVQSHNSQDSLQDLPSNHSRFRETAT